MHDISCVSLVIVVIEKDGCQRKISSSLLAFSYIYAISNNNSKYPEFLYVTHIRTLPLNPEFFLHIPYALCSLFSLRAGQIQREISARS